ncbi:MAG: CDGSH iron-sulfur domain-containing protein [Rhodospirillales bacterium]|nr:CDGSH iron-sulfur domain-containing protein [Rhodospirillales bacterium]HJO72604.1 CDGSH iron-sulfur domain-containing protein [Rhodospirillales bacterium]
MTTVAPDKAQDKAKVRDSAQLIDAIEDLGRRLADARAGIGKVIFGQHQVIDETLITLLAGESYYWCTCGLSDKQPFCNGGHKEKGEFAPVEFLAEETKTYYLCGCKQNDGQPFCDGSHKTL